MSTPPLTMGAALLFWAWQTGYWVPAVLMAAILEGSRLSPRRWDLSPKEFNRLSDLCAVIVMLMFAYRYLASTGMASRWVPMAVFPLMAAQAWSTVRGVDLGAVFWSYRKLTQKDPAAPRRLMDLSPYYFVLIVVTAGAGNTRSPAYFAGLVVLTAWALTAVRPKASSLGLWAALLLAAAGLGYLGQYHLHRLHDYVQDKAVEWFQDLGPQDPFKSSTAFGEVGAIQLSNEILFRVKMEKGRAVSFLMREASYGMFRANNWLAPGGAFQPLSPAGEGRWELGPPTENERSLIVSQEFQRGKGLVRAPAGTFRISGLPAIRLTRNVYGAVRVEEGPGFAAYRVEFGPGSPLDGPPTDRDLDLPADILEAIVQVRDQWRLSEMKPEEIPAAIKKHFQDEYRYTLELAEKEPSRNPVADFLLSRKAGHCEYFATAAVHLLRSAGIPARYATGYMASDFSAFEKQFIVRARNAHAWTLAWVDGAWRDFDATPSVWEEVVGGRGSGLEPVSAFFSWLGYRFSLWRWSESETRSAWYLWLLLIPLAAILAYRLRGRRWTRAESAGPSAATGPRGPAPGMDSEFYHLEERLAAAGRPRFSWETHAEWLERIGEPDLGPILDLHNRLRFDPAGLTERERGELASRVDLWLSPQD